ncbi:MAG: sugar nucleotide-binding protein, partial [Planctomycetota bacterium]|nr:sugar nucleotide-binding protein [Planctomycetota bacterium]
GEGAVELLDTVRPEEVIHCAAMSRTAPCEAEPELAVELNARVPGAIAAWCAARGARLIHVSTDLVFGATDAPSGGFEEEAEPAPLSVYGRTKLEGEQAVLDAFPSATVARLPLLYGNSGGRGLGASDSLLEALERGDRPRLFVDEWRTPLEVSNAAEALVELLEFDHGGALHLAGPDRVTRHVFGLGVLAALGLAPGAARAEIEEARQADLDPGAPRPRDVSLDARLAARHLETALRGVEAGMARAVAP